MSKTIGANLDLGMVQFNIEKEWEKGFARDAHNIIPTATHSLKWMKIKSLWDVQFSPQGG